MSHLSIISHMMRSRAMTLVMMLACANMRASVLTEAGQRLG